MSRHAPVFDVFGCPLQDTRLIEASAGTGKTWTLCGLYLRLLLERALPVAEILVVTFTNAATAELRERIRERIAETLARLRGTGAKTTDPFVDTLLKQLRDAHGHRDEDMKARLDLALQSFDEASILTIHGFCQRALAEAPFSTGMPMQLELLDDDRELRMQVVHDFWRRRIAGPSLSPALAGYLLDRKDTPERLGELLQRRLGKPMSRWLWPDGEGELPDAAPRDAAFAAARALWQVQREAIVAIVHEAQPRLNQNTHSPKALQTSIRAWDALLASPIPPDVLDPEQKLELLGSTRLRARRMQAPVHEHDFFEQAQQLIDACQAREQALGLQRLQLLRELVDHGPQALRRAKREQRVLGFDDMLFNLHERLAGAGGAALAATLRRRFGAALVDEFQDTDPLQYAIFDAIYRDSGAPLFLVGDPKQAIYSFRHADLHTYLRARGDAQAEYTLDENQRSSQALLQALNGLFGTHPGVFMQHGLDYRPVRMGARPRAPLVESPRLARAALQLWQLPRDGDGQPLLRAEAMRLAYAACASEIARLLASARDGQVRLGDRPLAAGDIAVLVRSHAQGAAMRGALAAVGVGSVELSQASIFDSADAAELERLLAAVLEPQREPLLRAALATEAMGRDAAALQALAGDEAGLLDCIGRFAAYRHTWLTRGVGRMLREWNRAEGVSRRLLQRPDGERRLTNLMHLAELLHEAATQHAGPDALLRWLREQRSSARRDDAAQLRLESDRNLVQVVTIHKSKGLEYPLVFCPMLWDGHSLGVRRGEGLEYRSQGEAVVDMRALGMEATKQHKVQQAVDAAAETMRLIYVALTRAVHRCTLVIGPYMTPHRSGPSHAQSSRSRINWLVAGAGLSPEAWLQNKLTPQQIDAAWAALALRHAPQVALAPLPVGDQPVLAPEHPGADRLAALSLPRPLPAPWWIGSYSSLTHGARHEDAAIDHDLRVLPDPGDSSAAAAGVEADDILRFPRGAVAGECLHAVFERIDFSGPAGWPAAVEAALRRFAPALPADDGRALWSRMLLRMLHDVLQAPLPGGLRLAQVPPSRKLVELEFHLPSHRLDAAELVRTLRQQGQAVPALQFGTLSGYLRGFIDLVFEHDGRYYLLDWKSNHLGDAPQDYAPHALQRTMAQQGYQLQALLYALALHRHLAQRLPDYRFESHFGGVLYLFVRGVRPAWTGAGVHAQRPALPLLEALSALLDGEGAAMIDSPMPGDAAQQALAEGFAAHIASWAQRQGADEAAVPVARQAAHALSLATGNGHVCLRLADLQATLGEDAPPLAALRRLLLDSGVVGTPENPSARPMILDAQGRLYLHRDFDHERRLAQRLVRAAAAPASAVDGAARQQLDALFGAGDGHADWQKLAAALALRRRLVVISGGPGTGKTTTVVNLLACLLAQLPAARIALAAPTGKAAARMSEALRQRAAHLPQALRERLPLQATTVHRLLGAYPGGFQHDAARPLAIDVLVVDEASMLDLALARRLLDAVPDGARLVLLGDKDQLAAVESGAVFAELSADPSLGTECIDALATLCGLPAAAIAPAAPVEPGPLRDTVVWLSRNFRFGADSGIGRAAEHIRQGHPVELLDQLRDPSDPSLQWLDDGGAAPSAATLQRLLDEYGSYFDALRRDAGDVASIMRAFERFRVLCAVREGPRGVGALNHWLSQQARAVLAGGEVSASPWYPGRPVMVLRNDPLLKLFNGDIGITLPGARGEPLVHFADAAGAFRALPALRLPAHETAFAMTVHKAQGSEFDQLLVLLPAQRSRVLTRELLYTALTRARQRVMLAADAAVLAAAVASRTERQSGLRARLFDAASHTLPSG